MWKYWQFARMLAWMTEVRKPLVSVDALRRKPTKGGRIRRVYNQLS